MAEKAKSYMLIGILVTIFTSLSATIIYSSMAWAVGTLNNVDPIAKSVNNLTIMVKDGREESSQQFSELFLMIHQQNTRIIGNETKLFRVIEDCKENYRNIQECKEFSYGKISL